MSRNKTQRPNGRFTFSSALAVIGLAALAYVAWPWIAAAIGLDGQTAVTIQPPVVNQPQAVQIVVTIVAPFVEAAPDAANVISAPIPPRDTGGDTIQLSTGQMARQTAEFVLACWEAEQRGEALDPFCPEQPAEVLGTGR